MTGGAFEAYRFGVAVGSLEIAQAALTTAFGHVLPALGYDHPFSGAIREAQAALRVARLEETKVEWDSLPSGASS